MHVIEPETPHRIGIATEKVRQIIVKARQYDGKEANSDPDSGSDAIDDGMTDVLQSHGNDPVRRELVSFIRAMNEDEQITLIALAWLGRGTYERSEWLSALKEAKTQHNKRTAEYLLSLPLLGDYLEEGLAAHGLVGDEDEKI